MTSCWPNVPLGDILAERKEVPADDALSNGKIRIVAKVGFSDGRIQFRADGQTKTGMILIRPGDLVISGINATKGAIAVYDEQNIEPIAATIHYGAYIPNKVRVDVSYLWWLLRSRTFRDLLLQYVPGGIKTELKAKRLLPIPIPLPPLEEQRRIVARIEELASKIAETRALRRQAVEKRTAIIGAAVSRIDGELRASHETACLAELASKDKGAIRSGPFGSSLLHSEFVEEGVPAVGIEDVQENRFILSRRWHVTPQKAAELARFRIRPGDVLVTVMGTLGRTCVVPDKIPHMISTKHIWTLTLDQDLAFGPWVSYWLNYSTQVRKELLGQTTGTAIGGLNGKKIREVSLPFIPLPEQRRIVVYLDDLQAKVDAIKRLQAETAAELDAMLPSVLDRAFSGEL